MPVALTAPVPADASPSPSAPRQLLVLWASQTGNAEELAAHTGKHLSETGRPVSLRSMDDAAPTDLRPGTDVVITTSTFGGGEAPDNGAWTSPASAPTCCVSPPSAARTGNCATCCVRTTRTRSRSGSGGARPWT